MALAGKRINNPEDSQCLPLISFVPSKEVIAELRKTGALSKAGMGQESPWAPGLSL